jgi:chromate transport protein ChrA
LCQFLPGPASSQVAFSIGLMRGGYGYHQIFAEDAMSAMSAEEHVFTIAKTFPRIGLVRKTEEILTGL